MVTFEFTLTGSVKLMRLGGVLYQLHDYNSIVYSGVAGVDFNVIVTANGHNFHFLVAGSLLTEPRSLILATLL